MSVQRRAGRIIAASVWAWALIACGGGNGGGSSNASSSYTVGGSVTGLTGMGLVLQDNGGDSLTVSASGSFEFSTTLANGAAYAVSVATAPSDPVETCAVSSGSGTIAGSSVTNVAISCNQNIAASAPNVAPIIVDSGPAALPVTDQVVNAPFVTVTICAPGSSTNCQSIDHVEVDTGSYGLRILASVLSSSLYTALPQINETRSGEPLAECTVFVDGYSWGPIKSADVHISGESASAVAIQLIGDPAYPHVPADCASTGTEEDTVDSFGANGIIGVGPFVQDCGTYCSSGAQSADYYVCASISSCTDSTVSLAQQVLNPVTLFQTDNNGTIVELPPISLEGAATASGALVFGIGTQGNNGLAAATVLTVDDTYGYLSTQFNGKTLSDSFLDSGSSAFYFNDGSIPTCSDQADFYCPSSTLSLSAMLVGLNNASSAVSFSVANTDNLSEAYFAFDDLAGTNTLSNSFDWGLPFFFGRDVYTAIEGYNTSGGLGPYFAY